MMGESSVGKTSVMRRFVEDGFDPNYVASIGVEFRRANIKQDDGCMVKMNIFDTAGQERFTAITRQYLRSAHATVLVYDITNTNTFARIPHWIKILADEYDEAITGDAFQVLVGNKTDLESNRKVSRELGESLAETYSLPFFETSAKTGEQVKEGFEHLAKMIHDHRFPAPKNCTIKVGNESTKSQRRGIRRCFRH